LENRCQAGDYDTTKLKDLQVDPRLPRRGLLDNGHYELPIVSDHVVAVDSLRPIHKDPFDRLLVAQATVEGVTLLTVDPLVAGYPVLSARSEDKEKATG